MKNIYIRAGMSPLDNNDSFNVMTRNLIGGNVGNLLYSYGLFRTLMTEGTTVTPNYYSANKYLADKISEEYDCFVIPLADAFRTDFMWEFQNLTDLVKNLKIPCIVTGVGLRAPFEPGLHTGFVFDELAKSFVSAVLEKSSIVGVRGQITSDYLSKLGFKEGRDHTVIGCPSMYTFGKEINIRNTNIDANSTVCVNSSTNVPESIYDYTFNNLKLFQNHYFVPQELAELKLTYIGASYIHESFQNYPSRATDPIYKENRARFFVNVPTWIDFLRQADFSFGSRLHGNIVATLAGTPSILFPHDARTRELAEYHNLTCVMPNELDGKTNIFDIIEKVDFQSPTKHQSRNFDHYISFLEKNGLDHIYKNGTAPLNVPFDNEISVLKMNPPVQPLSGCTYEETVERTAKYHLYYEENIKTKNSKIRDNYYELIAKNKDIKNKDKEINNLSKKIKEKQKIINDQTKLLNYNSIKFVIKIRSVIAKTNIVGSLKNITKYIVGKRAK